MLGMVTDARRKDYDKFAALAQRAGYKKADPEDIVIPSDITYDVQGGTAGKDTGAPAVQTFFNSTTSDLVVQCQDPPILHKQQIGGEFLLCVYAYGLQWGAQSFAGTLVESAEVNAALSRSIFSLQFGSDRVLTNRGRYCITDDPGLIVGNDGAGTAVPSRGESNAKAPVPMSSPRVLGSTQVVLAQHFVSKASWTVDNDFVLSLNLMGWLARKS